MRFEHFDSHQVASQVFQEDGVLTFEALARREQRTVGPEPPAGHGIEHAVEIAAMVNVRVGEQNRVELCRINAGSGFRAAHQRSWARVEHQVKAEHPEEGPGREPDLPRHHEPRPRRAEELDKVLLRQCLLLA